MTIQDQAKLITAVTKAGKPSADGYEAAMDKITKILKTTEAMVDSTIQALRKIGYPIKRNGQSVVINYKTGEKTA